MPLRPGSRLGSFEIVSAIGAGGMGEVYRARDERLHRDVAIKVLPDAVAADPERLARFEREARTLALLNHSNIAQIYGLEQRALVMELVEGEDLAARIQRGPLPADEAITIARQIAEALDAAHSAGIVHRDLKPANVRIRPDGVVKVLDFGLAKALAPAEIVPNPAESPTITSPAGMTGMGVILGSAAYMSPEQARGRAVDKRADIWAFGCVLYEMLTGRRPFDGDTVTDVLSAILKEEPDWASLPPDTPPRIVALLHHCLRKDPARRLRDIGDAIDRIDAPGTDVVPGGGAQQRRWLPIAAGLMLAIAAGAAGYALRRPEPLPLLKFQVALQTEGGAIREQVISPDGSRVAYAGRSRLHVHDLAEWKSRELEGTEAAARPFWSPDGEWIGYFRSEALLKVSSHGGPVVRIATLPASQGRFGNNAGAWTADGNITVIMGSGSLLRVPAAGGTPVEIPYDDPNMVGLRDLEVLPGGALVGASQTRAGLSGLAVLDRGRIRSILDMPNVRHPAYSPTGHLVFQRGVRDESIWAVKFSPDRLEVAGEPFLVSPGVDPSVGANGTLIFVRDAASALRQLAWITLDGAIVSRMGDPREWTEGVAISPDGTRVLASATDGIWLYDRHTGARSRMTTGSDDLMPAWVSGERMLFVRGSPYPALMIKPVSTVGGEKVLADVARFPRVTRDGSRVVFNMRPRGGGLWQVAWIDLDRPEQIHQLGAEHAGARFPSISPDGSLVAYVSGEMGRDEVFVTRLPDGQGKWQASIDGGGWTLFSPAGDTLIYRASDGALMSVPIVRTAGRDLQVRPARKLFDWGAGWAPFYDLTRDGRGALVAIPLGQSFSVPSLSVIQNWHREFQGR